VPGPGDDVRTAEIPYRNALNEIVRNAYVEDCAKGVARWNRWIERAGLPMRLELPSTRFRRTIGSWAGVPTDCAGNRISAEAYAAQLPQWLPSDDDRAFVHSLMRPVLEPGKTAAWIAPPERGIQGKPIDYEYVRLA
jgi:benzoyl-CoA 2,3-dioxygenase component B